MEHHTLDPYPVPKEKAPLYVNEPSGIFSEGSSLQRS